MNLVVCVKQVPATEARLAVTEQGRDIRREQVSLVLNPYDEFALEEALRIKERLGRGAVTVLALKAHAADRPEEALRACLAMGADRAVLLSDPALDGGDSLATATALAAALRRLPFDLVLCGKQAVDDDEAAVGIQTAELLGLPHVSVVTKLALDAAAGTLTAERQIEGGVEVVEAMLPALVTCQKGLNEPRYASLAGIMGAKRKPLEVWTLETLGLGPETVGAAGARLTLVKLEPPPPRPAGRTLRGEPAAVVQELVRLLREEAKVL